MSHFSMVDSILIGIWLNIWQDYSTVISIFLFLHSLGRFETVNILMKLRLILEATIGSNPKFYNSFLNGICR